MRDVLPGIIFDQLAATGDFLNNSISRASLSSRVRKIPKDRLLDRFPETFISLFRRFFHSTHDIISAKPTSFQQLAFGATRALLDRTDERAAG